jgi:hypothetical protein
MMVLSARRPDASLLEFLADRARSASVRRLAIDAAVGVSASVAAIRWTETFTLLVASAGILLACYGAWGLFDRARTRLERDAWRRTLGLIDAICALSAVLGVLAASGILYGVWAVALGTWIS